RDDTHHASGGHHAISTEQHASVSTARSFLVSACQAVRLFAQKTGMRLFAGSGDIEMQAQSDNIEWRAKDKITLQADTIDFSASDYVLVNGAGSYFRLSAMGIESGTDGEWISHASHDKQSGPGQQPVVIDPMPIAMAFDERFQAVNKTLRKPVSDLPFIAQFDSGAIVEGATDQKGYTPRFRDMRATAVEITWGGLQEGLAEDGYADTVTDEC
ncbi:MAG: DUF2345 domain-containing protein, partial [Comamonadaceae bacterium]